MDALQRLERLRTTSGLALVRPGVLHAPRQVAATGLPALDTLLGGGWPRGRTSELVGPRSSGRTSVLLRSLARATTAGAWAALVDVSDGFDPVSAAACGVRRDRLLWVRCGGRLGSALQAADVIVRGGGFEVIAVDLGDLAPPALGRIPVSALVRLQRGVERTPTALVFVGPQRVAGSTSALALALTPARVRWAPGGPGLLTALTVDARLVRARERVPGTGIRLAWRIPGTTGWAAGGHEE